MSTVCWFQFRHQWICQWYPQLQQGQCHLFKHRGVVQLFLQSWIYWWWTHLPSHISRYLAPMTFVQAQAFQQCVNILHHGFLSSLWGSFQTSAKVLRIPLNSSNENATCKNSEGSSKSTCKLVFSGSGHNYTNNEFSRWKNPKYLALCGRSPFDDPENFFLFSLIHELKNYVF